MGIGRLFILLFLALLTCTAKADPSNVLVGDMTFARPENWKWEQATEHSKAIRFVIPPSPAVADQPALTDVRFYAEKEGKSHSDEAWKTRFPDSASEAVREKQKQIGKRQVSYLILKGSYIGAENQIKRDYMLISATIPYGEKVIHVRILGPKHQVKAASATFKKMIEEGLAASQENETSAQ